MPDFDDFRYDEVAFKAAHNSVDRRESLADQLTWRAEAPHHGGCRGLELDLVQQPHRWEWCIKHGGRHDPNAPRFGAVLSDLLAWSEADRDHDPVTVHLDLKGHPGSDDVFPGEFDAYIRHHFDADRLVTPGELMAGAEDLVRGARANGWPRLAQMRGRFVFCLSGTEPRKARYARLSPSERLCFADHYMGTAAHILPSTERGTRIFFNFWLRSDSYDWDARIPWFTRQPGFVVRGFGADLQRVWKRALHAGVNVIATDQVSTAPWAHVGAEAFAPTGALVPAGG
jgi:hypothetical protein